MIFPPSPVMAAVRVSQTNSSAGSTPGVVKARGMLSPRRSAFLVFERPFFFCPVASSRSIISPIPPPAGSRPQTNTSPGFARTRQVNH
jgi:hypothetical protein